ncbi:unnamed protein product [Sympodiomycopsis kandeliae]
MTTADHHLVAKDTLKLYAALALAGFVWSVTPVSWIVVLYRFSTAYLATGKFLAWPSRPDNWFLRLFWFNALCEVPFSIYLARLHHYAKRDHPPPDATLETLSASLIRALSQHSSSVNLTEKEHDIERDLMLSRLCRWFHNADPKDIKQDNVREWLAWAFGGTTLKECTSLPGRSQIIEKGLKMVQERCNFKFEPGYNPKVKALRLTLDDIKTSSRPFGYYVVCNGISHTTMAWLRYIKGYRKERHGQCEFLILPPKGTASSSSGGNADKADTANHPILFLHGLGIGLGQYAPFLRRLSNHTHGVMILLQPNISADISHPRYLDPPSKEDVIEAVKFCTRKYHFTNTTILSHSNGTMIHGWLLREAPRIGRRHVLVDPVCFRLWEGATSYAFLAKKWGAGIEVLLGYFVARELGISYTICRKFIWWDMIMWAEDLAGLDSSRLQIVIGGNDVLIDVESVQKYLHLYDIGQDQVHVQPGAQHGQALFLPSQGMRKTCQALGLAF